MTNARYRRKQLAKRDGSLAPVAPADAEVGPDAATGPAPGSGTEPSPAPDADRGSAPR